MKRILAIALIMGALSSCGGGKVTIEGEFAACPEQSVILEGISAGGSVVSDTLATTGKNGNFRLSLALPDGESSFYNLRCAERTIPLILSEGERVTINSVPGLIDGYTVSGSKESELVREVKNILMGGLAKLDSLTTAYGQTTNKASQQTIAQQYTQTYLDIKRAQIEFIVTNSGNLAAIYALNQRLPGDESLFGGKNDIVYFRLVAEEVEKNYPSSPYLAGLKAAIDAYDRQVSFNNMVSEALAAEPASFPEIALPDMYGKKQSLTELQKGKVVLLDFWTLVDENASFRNAELKEIYADYHDKGFEIYQVSVDTSKPHWVEIVQMQKLPWVSVCDFKGSSSVALQLYGVGSVPQNFLIDSEGNIVARNAYGDDLRGELKRLFK